MMPRWAERVFGVVDKELRQVFRDPRLARVVLIAPLIQLLVFGYAVSTDVRHTETGVVDHDASPASRELLETLTATGYFDIVRRSDRPADMIGWLDRGEVMVAVQVPAEFEADLLAGRPASVQVLVDGTNSNTATIAQGYAERIVRGFAAGEGVAPAIDLRERAWFNPDLESRNYNVPAVVGVLVLLICLLLTSLAVVRERELGTLEQLRVSPLGSGELIAGKTIPFALIAFLDLTLVSVVAVFWFDIPLRGSPAVLAAASVLYVLAGLGLGLLVSSISSTQQEAFMASFLVFMPAILLSGFMFPVSSMPEVFQWLTLANPVRHYIEIVRALYLKGAAVSDLSRQFGFMLLLGPGLLLLAADRFRRSAA